MLEFEQKKEKKQFNSNDSNNYGTCVYCEPGEEVYRISVTYIMTLASCDVNNAVCKQKKHMEQGKHC